MIRPLLLAAALAAALVLVACGEREEPADPGVERFEVVLDFFPNADHAGLFAALEGGGFRRAGLDVRARTPSDPAAPLRLLAAGRADVAISYPPELQLAREKGADLVAIGAMVQRPLTSLVSLPKGRVRQVSDLRGKTVSTAGIPYQDAYLRTILRRAGVPEDSVRSVDVGFNLSQSLLSGRADASLGPFWNYEGVALQRERRRPRILRLDDLGVPTYPELIFVARREALSEPGAGGRFRAFLRTVGRGWEVVRRDPDAGVDALLAANDDLERGQERAAIRATLPVVFPRDRDRPFGFIDERQWDRYLRWAVRERVLTRRPEGRGLTNEFLPGEGLRPDEAGAVAEG